MRPLSRRAGIIWQRDGGGCHGRPRASSATMREFSGFGSLTAGSWQFVPGFVPRKPGAHENSFQNYQLKGAATDASGNNIYSNVDEVGINGFEAYTRLDSRPFTGWKLNPYTEAAIRSRTPSSNAASARTASRSRGTLCLKRRARSLTSPRASNTAPDGTRV